MPGVEANGLCFHVQELGRAGPPVVMLHGLLGTLSAWYFTVAPRLAKRHRVLLYDLRGHGLSERPPSGYSVDAMAKDLGALVDGFSAAPVSLVGHSYGAVVALRYAIDHPERVDRLILIEAPLPILLADVTGDLVGLLPRYQRAALAGRGRRKSSPFRRQVVELLTETTLGADLRAEPEIAPEEIAGLKLPVLLCYGSESPLAADMLARLGSLLPDARREVIAGGHFLPQEAPQELGEAIAAFLDA